MTRTATSILVVLLTACLTACAPNAATFYEGTRFAFATEYNPASSEPVSLTLGYKRRIAAIVPPQEAAPPSSSQNPNPTAKGEALSLVSTFDVQPAGTGIGDGIVVKNIFASGMAARDLTANNADSNVRGLFTATSLPLLSPSAENRRVALVQALRGKVDNAKADALLKAAGLRPTPPAGCTDKATEALCTLQSVLSRTDEKTLERLESAATQVIFAPSP